jgi:hypothetical protein
MPLPPPAAARLWDHALVVGDINDVGGEVIKQLAARQTTTAVVLGPADEIDGLLQAVTMASGRDDILIPAVCDPSQPGDIPELFSLVVSALEGLDLVAYIPGGQPAAEALWLHEAAAHMSRLRHGTIVLVHEVGAPEPAAEVAELRDLLSSRGVALVTVRLNSEPPVAAARRVLDIANGGPVPTAVT